MPSLRRWAALLKRDVLAIYFAARDPCVPFHAKVLALVVAGYALSPIDLVPDFIPVLGLVDDLVLVPLGIWLVVRLIPPGAMAEHRLAAALAVERPVSQGAAAVVVGIWVLAAGLAGWVAWRWLE